MKNENTSLLPAVSSDELLAKRLEQGKEMAQIWEENDELTKMYLRGCIATATALAGGRR